MDRRGQELALARRRDRQDGALTAIARASMSRYALSESPPSCVRRKQRVLCLHSFRTSGAILKQQLFLFSNLGTLSQVQDVGPNR